MSLRSVPRFHVITDTVLQTRFDETELARLAAEGGADAIQYRDKRELDPTQAAARLAAIRAVLHPTVALIVNDRWELARHKGADGLHLGRQDLDAAAARKALGKNRWIGRTANDLAEAISVSALPIDYLGVGPVFGTASKVNPAPRLGLAGLQAIVKAVELPVIAIGGIRADQVGAVMQTGCHGIAVLSEVVCAADPREAAQRFRAELELAGSGQVRLD